MMLTMLDPLVKTSAKWYSKQCATCGTTRIEAVLNNFKEKTSCLECKKYLTFGNILLRTLTMYMKMDSKELSDLSSDKEVMATINALIRGVSRHGLTAIKIGMPLYVVFDVTSRCNLNCIHCYSSKKQEEMTTSDVYHIIDMLHEAGTGIIDFGGGEPLLRNDIFDILSYSKGTYEKTIEGIKNCTDAGIDTRISTVFMKSNIGELVDIYNLLNSLDVDGWYIYDFVPAGRGKELQNEVLDQKQRKQLFEYLQGIAVSSKIKLNPYPYLITINSAYGKDTYFYKRYGRLTEFFKGCL